MKVKLLPIFFVLCGIISVNAQVTDFITENIGEPKKIILHNNVLYFIDDVYNPDTWGYADYIKRIDLSQPTPQATVLYGPLPEHKSLWGLAVKENKLYTVVYNESNNKSTFTSFNLSDSSPVPVEHLTLYGYIGAIAIKDNFLYHTQVNASGGPISLQKISTTFSGDVEDIAFLGIVATNDMHFDGDILYLTTQGVKWIDVSEAIPTLTTLKTGNFYDGIHIAGGYVVYSDTGLLKKFPISNPDDVTVFTSDSLWIRDIVNNGQNIYATAYHKIVMITDETLTLSHINPVFYENWSVLAYPNPTNNFLNFSEKLNDATIYDITGRTIKTFTGTHEKIDVSDLSKGNYILKGETKSGEKFNAKFVKK